MRQVGAPFICRYSSAESTRDEGTLKGDHSGGSGSTPGSVAYVFLCAVAEKTRLKVVKLLFGDHL